MDIVVGLSVRPSVRLFVYGIIGRWLLPSLVDTGDICCHYWQHILVEYRYWIGPLVPTCEVAHFDGLVRDCSNSIANALELLQSCTKPSI